MFKSIAVNIGILLLPIVMPTIGNAQSDTESGVKDLAKQISESMVKTEKKKIAVVELTDLDDNTTRFGQFIAEELITQLFMMSPGKFEVVERRQLAKLLKEQKLGAKGLLEPESMKRIGKLLGVDAIVSGSYTDLGNTIKINARLISVSTASIFAVASTNIPKVGTVEALLGKIPTQANSSGNTNNKPTQETPTTHTADLHPPIETGDLTIRLTKCKHNGKSLEIHMSLVSTKDARIVLYVTASRAIDYEGNEYIGESARIGSVYNTNNWVANNLISGIPMKASMQIKGVPITVSKIAVLELSVHNGVEQQVIQIRDITVANSK